MWTWLKCYLSRRHEYGVWCQDGAIYLRCLSCGHRSDGWKIQSRPSAPSQMAGGVVPTLSPARVLPFARRSA